MVLVSLVCSGCVSDTQSDYLSVTEESYTVKSEITDDEWLMMLVFVSSPRNDLDAGSVQITKYIVEPHEETFAADWIFEIAKELDAETPDKQDTVSLFEIEPTESEQQLIIASDRCILHTALVENDEIIKRKDIDVSEFTGYVFRSQSYFTRDDQSYLPLKQDIPGKYIVTQREQSIQDAAYSLSESSEAILEDLTMILTLEVKE